MGKDVWVGLFQPELGEQASAGIPAGEEYGPPLPSVMELLDEQTAVDARPDKEGTLELMMLAVEESPD